MRKVSKHYFQISGYWLPLLLLLSCYFNTVGQYINSTPRVRAVVDSSSIQIGSVARFVVQVPFNENENVVFPSFENFSPFEVLEATPIDTLKQQGISYLVKQYALTNFEPENAYIPPQGIQINNKSFYTDSLRLEVRDVVIDTSKTKLYDVKGLLGKAEGTPIPWQEYLLWGLGILGVVVLLFGIFWIFYRKKRADKKQLPPLEKAVQELSKLENSSLLEQKAFKSYYSKLTDLAKEYLENQVTNGLKESTSDQIIKVLEAKIKKRGLLLKSEDLENFHNALKTADLSKFAAINPGIDVAKRDRKHIEDFLKLVDKSLPEPTHEEIIQSKAYKEAQLLKQKRKRRIIRIGSIGLVLLALGTAGLSSKYYSEIKDYVIEKTGTAVYYKDWITSTYGVPGIQIHTPGLLTRNLIALNEKDQQMIAGNQVYILGSLDEGFHVLLNTLSFRQDVGFTLEKGVESVFKQLEKMGGANIVIKNEDFETLYGTNGLKVFGSLDYTSKENNYKRHLDYTILIFDKNTGAQQLYIFYDSEKSKAKEAMENIVKSVKITQNSL